MQYKRNEKSAEWKWFIIIEHHIVLVLAFQLLFAFVACCNYLQQLLPSTCLFNGSFCNTECLCFRNSNRHRLVTFKFSKMPLALICAPQMFHHGQPTFTDIERVRSSSFRGFSVHHHETDKRTRACATGTGSK